MTMTMTMDDYFNYVWNDEMNGN